MRSSYQSGLAAPRADLPRGFAPLNGAASVVLADIAPGLAKKDFGP
jgi:hypothetical protein